MRIPPAIVQLRRAQLILVLAMLVPTVLLTVLGIILLVFGATSGGMVAAGILVLTFCTSTITGYILVTIFVGRGANLARIQSDFLSSVSHELRTPLTSIRLFLASLRDNRLDPADQGKVIELLGGEVERLDKLVLRVLELSRLESGRHAFERARVGVVELIDEAVAAFDAATLSNPTPITRDLEPGLAFTGDRPTMVRAVSNLLINAWKYTGPDKQISVTARSAGSDVEIEVTDNGIGIGRGDQLDIFEQFARGKGAIDRGTAGVGLGLAFVRAIARAHKGTVSVWSRPDEGSTFRIKIPKGRLAIERAGDRTLEERREPA